MNRFYAIYMAKCVMLSTKCPVQSCYSLLMAESKADMFLCLLSYVVQFEYIFETIFKQKQKTEMFNVTSECFVFYMPELCVSINRISVNYIGSNMSFCSNGIQFLWILPIFFFSVVKYWSDKGKTVTTWFMTFFSLFLYIIFFFSLIGCFFFNLEPTYEKNHLCALVLYFGRANQLC